MQNPVRGFLHGAGALFAVIGLVALLVRSEEASMRMAGAVYGLALVSMFTTSALYHAVPWGSDWKSRLQMLDHTFIYMLVAGTATPLLVAALHGGWLAAGLTGIWGLAGLGMVQEFSKRRTGRTVLALQFVAGAIALIPIASTFTGIDATVAVLMLAGGVSYLIGTLLFVNSRPRLRPGIFSHHEFFHVVVILASALHFLAVWRIVAL